MVRDASSSLKSVILGLLALALLLLSAFRPETAVAAPVSLPDAAASPACLANATGVADLSTLLARSSAWNCNRSTWSTDSGHSVLRFAPLIAGRVPDHLATRLSRFDGIRLGIEGLDGKLAWHRLDPDHFVPYGHMVMAMPLPEAGTPARAVLLEVEGATVSGQLAQARLWSGGIPDFQADEILIAIFAGLLIAPLLFNLAFYRVLRERFLLWHAAVVCSMLAQIVVTTGLMRFIGPVRSDIVSYMVATTFSAGIASAMMLAKHFIEPDKLSAQHRRTITHGAIWVMLNCAIFVALVEGLKQWAVRFYMVGWIPVMAILLWTMVVALRNGSRVVWYQIAAWAPMTVVGLGRIALNLAGATEPAWLFRVQDGAIVFDVLVISLGIIDRFVVLRRERDRHRLRARKLERLAERDPLTGLMNRRAIEPHFARLRADGFATFAVVDIDRFKEINDRFGHGVGDRVLQAAAQALAPNDDMLSMRLGGEEFVLMLRGRDALRQAERSRLALSTRIASEVQGLDRIVTASMGLVEIPEDVMPKATFSAIYSRADALLYQAKNGGRNRTVSERLTSFAKPPRREAATG